jgi:putative acetyltransferase
MVNLSSNQSVKPSYPNGNRPWAIARILPNAKVYIVARFRNRQDADDHVRILHRFIPAASLRLSLTFPTRKKTS